MCRHLAYLGTRRSLSELVLDPPHGLATQAWAPRRQRHGTINVDGFGAGWYVSGRATPVRYRRAQPIWSDLSFASLAPTVTAGCALAAVRSATPGTGVDESCAAPFTHGRWLFSHNGVVVEPALAGKALREAAAEVPDARAPVDSALLFGLAVAHWQAGAALGDGLLEAARQVAAVSGGRLTALAADGTGLAGLTWGEPLYLRTDPTGSWLAAEPDDEPGWQELADHRLVGVDGSGITTREVRP